MDNNTVQDIFQVLNDLAPLALQNSYDNSGLICGSMENVVHGILISLDCTEEIIEEAIANGCNLVLSHHPIWFGAMKSLTGKNYVERTIIKAIKNDINIMAWHTNLDNVLERGVNDKIADQLKLTDRQILMPSEKQLKVRAEGGEAILLKLSGDLKKREIQTMGGTTTLAWHIDNFEKRKWKEYLRNGYHGLNIDFLPTEESSKKTGSGLIGELPEKMSLPHFLKYLKTQMDLEVIKYTKNGAKICQRIAVCGGAGSFLISAARKSGADVFITGDLKYHEFFDGEDSCTLMDIGHYESEKYTIDLLHSILTEKFSIFAILKTKKVTNPIEYYH